jgi:hypothetical protein
MAPVIRSRHRALRYFRERTNENSPKTATTTCPDGTNVIGGGYQVRDVTSGNIGSWALQAFAICASTSP